MKAASFAMPVPFEFDDEAAPRLSLLGACTVSPTNGTGFGADAAQCTSERDGLSLGSGESTRDDEVTQLWREPLARQLRPTGSTP